jgi:hypothetical protein
VNVNHWPLIAVSSITALCLAVAIVAAFAFRRRKPRVAVRSREPDTGARPRAVRTQWHAMPLYPGATPDPTRDAGWSIDMRVGTSGFHAEDAYFRTAEPIARVVEWYRSALPEWTFRRLIGTEPVDAVAEFTYVGSDGTRSVRVYREPGRSGIVLSHTSRPTVLARRSG